EGDVAGGRAEHQDYHQLEQRQLTNAAAPAQLEKQEYQQIGEEDAYRDLQHESRRQLVQQHAFPVQCLHRRGSLLYSWSWLRVIGCIAGSLAASPAIEPLAVAMIPWQRSGNLSACKMHRTSGPVVQSACRASLQSDIKILKLKG